MARGEHEAVAVEPLGVLGAVLQRVTEEHRADLGAAERQAEVAALDWRGRRRWRGRGRSLQQL